MYILVTGGAGYIGSHTVVELINHGYKVIVVDNLCNSSYDAISRIEFIVKQPVLFFNVDIRDFQKLSLIFQQYKVSSVIHFAALKAVGESTTIPLDYYDNNIIGTIKLLEAMKANQVKSIVFSSSATVYGDVTRFGRKYIPIPEDCPNEPTNPYGHTKVTIESILHDLYTSDPQWKTAILRYFNPIGAHPSGLIGEDPLGIPQNLLPYLAQVAIGRREKLAIFGNDYDSHDGTPIRDYIHVIDLAKGHISALEYLSNNTPTGSGIFREWNLGTGKGSTVFEVYHAFCKAVGRDLPYEVVGRRSGDVLNLTANPKRANEELKWETKLTIEDACKDLWNWTTNCPLGYNVNGYKWLQFSDKEISNRRHTVVNGDLEVSILNYGATIQSIKYKGKQLVLGLDTEEEYKNQKAYLGATIGRYANRFELHSKNSVNEIESVTLHGGKNGFDKQNFLGPLVKNKDSNITLEFLLIDPHMNNGFEGDLETIVKFIISGNSIEVDFQAKLLGKADETFVNLTNHTYWNLSNNTYENGIDGTKVKVATNKYLEVDSKLLATGKILTKEVTELKNIDLCYVLDENPQKLLDTRNLPLVPVFEGSDPNSTTWLTVQTTEPSFQVYSGDFTDIPGKFGPRSGFCVEPGRFVSAANKEEWKAFVTLKKGDTYGSKLKYIFQ